ncbi:MAG: hypothetical protein A3H93_18330 [Rhodocyclales bacterium RIFCSPLOWO2_02_FULL_63_24]|nr:MAG: hypothetical protein A2040_06865 [Rhodocyclales bacterium GWA2_65_19]OHC67017.1 MAG: hypothetical protein A3H93_18330 [Rhodocyclales bacterium RIFCSPLOWO2_02_FULL_63_24]
MPAKPRITDAPPRVSGETYFFRDHGQFDLLRLRLLPELIERRRASKTLRLWSAGCASGEEAYSLAMLVDLLLPRRDGWEILVLGVDIDAAALAKAVRGRYGQWSFRMTPPQLQQRYFRRIKDEWAIDEGIRRMVRFRAVDLVGEPLSTVEFRDMDLVLCRNVFIYFDAGRVAAVAAKLAASLAEGGYLMAGHTELIGHAMANVRSRLFAEGVVYQRTATPPPASVAAAASVARPPRGAMSKLKRAQASPRAATERVSVPAIAAPATQGSGDLLAAARQLADRGEYSQAGQACRQALAIDPLAAEAHFLLAQLAQLDGDFEQAGQLLEKTIYLDPGDVAAYLELAALCERAENLSRAQGLRQAALDIVRRMPAATVVKPYDATAGELAQWLAQ